MNCDIGLQFANMHGFKSRVRGEDSVPLKFYEKVKINMTAGESTDYSSQILIIYITIFNEYGEVV